MIQLLKKIWPIEILSLQAFQHLYQQSEVLMAGKRGARLLQDQNTIHKIFMPRNGFSSNQFWPYAIRFYQNSHQLIKRGITAPLVDRLAFFPDNQYYIVRYQKIRGIDCRNYLQIHSLNILQQLAHFLAELHSKGIFFRGIHLGNILYQAESNGFALIDLTGCHFSWRALSLHKRLRNLKHLLNHPDDQHYFLNYGHDLFLQEYCAKAELPRWKQKIIVNKLNSICKN